MTMMLGGYDLERLLDALRMQESRGNNAAVSPKGARGEYQFMRPTWEDPGYGVTAKAGGTWENFIANPDIQRKTAAEYLKAMYDRTGDVGAALAAYNGGLGRGLNYKQGKPVPKETFDYVPSVFAHYSRGGDNRPVNPTATNPLDFLNPIQAAHAAESGQAPGFAPGEHPLFHPSMLTPLKKDQSRLSPEPSSDAPPMVAAMQPPGPPTNIVPPVMQGVMNGEQPTQAEEELPFYKDRNYWKKALIGAGAGLSMINNPAGAAVAASMLEDLDENDSRYSTQQLYDGTVLKIERKTGDVTVVRPGSEKLKYKKEGLDDPATAEANFNSVTKNLDDMERNMDALINSGDDLGYITGTATSMLPTAPGSIGLSGGIAAKLQANYDTLQAAGTLDEVRQLKEQSATLGQISNYEDQLFQKAFAPISNKMLPEDFRAALLQKKQALAEIRQIMRQKYMSIYGKNPSTPSTPSDPNGSGFKIIGVEPN